jgi:hypothetical protein
VSLRNIKRPNSEKQSDEWLLAEAAVCERKNLKMLRFHIGTVEIKWDNIPAKQFVKIRSDYLEDIHRIISR